MCVCVCVCVWGGGGGVECLNGGVRLYRILDINVQACKHA